MQELKQTKSLKGRKNTLAFIFMLVVTVLFFYPFIIMLFVSLKSAKEALLSPNTIPKNLERFKGSLIVKLLSYKGIQSQHRINKPFKTKILLNYKYNISVAY